ncbi:MAG: hypothetical protein R3316_12240 [Rhodovibrionaceae bacterium]|nr:hypothetical protein [Rhodovibrionaceae bacterium]
MKFIAYPMMAAALLLSAHAVSAAEMEMSPTETALMSIYSEQKCHGRSFGVNDWARFLQKIRAQTGDRVSPSQMVHIKRKAGNKIGYCGTDQAMKSHEHFQSMFGA